MSDLAWTMAVSLIIFAIVTVGVVAWSASAPPRTQTTVVVRERTPYTSWYGDWWYGGDGWRRWW